MVKMRHTSALCIALTLCLSMRGQTPKLTPVSPLTLELSSVKQNADDAVLDLGVIGIGGPFETLLKVWNGSKEDLTIDAFSLGHGALALWEPADQTPSTRTSIAPGAFKTLRIRLVSVQDQKSFPSILFMK
jgi:hypothetical protein